MHHARKAGIATLVLGGTFAVGTLLGSLEAAPRDPFPGPPANDQDLVFSFRSTAAARSARRGGISIRQAEGGEARGRFVAGTLLRDKAVQRYVTVDPGRIVDYYSLLRNLPREVAEKKTAKLLRSVERTGRLGKLAAITRELQTAFGPASGAGVRLDDDAVDGFFPPALFDPEADLAAMRLTIAGDDALWEAHMQGDATAYPQLAAGGSDRFTHRIDLSSGVTEPRSVLRHREYRRLLIRKQSRTVTFLADVPDRADLSDAAFAPVGDAVMTLRRSTAAGLRSVKDVFGRRIAMSGRTLVLPIPTPIPEFVQSEGAVGTNRANRGNPVGYLRPRLTNVTPPNGEQNVDPTTDWEDPDNQFSVPLPARRPFVVRLRFTLPLDPRTVDETTFWLTHVRSGETFMDDPVEVSVTLTQNRLGNVEVALTPSSRLDPFSQYEVRVRGEVRNLRGELFGQDNLTSFSTR